MPEREPGAASGAASQPELIVVLGPTATGKTQLAVSLAQRFDGEIVGCDSMQVYRGFDAGTGKPAPSMREQVVHHLIDVADPARDFSLGEYVRLAESAIGAILARGRRPIVAGGTGLYLQGLLRGIFPAPPREPALRERLLAIERRRPGRALHGILRRVDPSAASRLAPRDTQRIVRALEVYFRTGRPLSDVLRTQGFGADRWTAVKIGLSVPRELLAARIAERVDQFLAAGWKDEVAGLLAEGPPEAANAWKALGYRQVARLVRGEIGLEEARAAIALETRQYARRQATWFRREPGVRWFEHSGAVPWVAIESWVAQGLGPAGMSG